MNMSEIASSKNESDAKFYRGPTPCHAWDTRLRREALPTTRALAPRNSGRDQLRAITDSSTTPPSSFAVRTDLGAIGMQWRIALYALSRVMQNVQFSLCRLGPSLARGKKQENDLPFPEIPEVSHLHRQTIPFHQLGRRSSLASPQIEALQSGQEGCGAPCSHRYKQAL